MKNMNEVYNKIKNDYPKLEVKLEANEKKTPKFSNPAKIIVIDNAKEIIAYEYVVELIYKSEIITHCHPDDYDDVYDSIIYYLKEDPLKIKKSIKKTSIIMRVILLSIIILILVIIELVAN